MYSPNRVTPDDRLVNVDATDHYALKTPIEASCQCGPLNTPSTLFTYGLD